jgi:3-methyladenine DNA glycosylase AlkD
MSDAEILKELKQLGTEQNRKVYRRHGVGKNQYGVSFANLRKLKKRIKVDHKLAKKLWATGNHDARVLATMVADPALLDHLHLESWVKDLDNYVVADAFSSMASQTALARQKMEDWIQSKEEWIGRAGWRILAHLAMEDHSLSSDILSEYLETIERTIHSGKNRVKDAMNGALIAVGIRNKVLEKRALAAAERIGKVQVDHGETSCKTPDAAAYIRKAVARRR